MLNPTARTTTVSNVSSGAQVMGIDAAGMGTVLSILSNMYSDGSLAVAREYICNALDSHVEAGNRDPVLVTSPSHLNPTFTVQDFGVGLSGDEVLNVYAKYGASTKRDSNEQIGAFGIGAKSAFTVGTQFVVTAVKDGELTIALFALNEAGAPTVNIVSNEATDEPNGVKVEIGVRDVQGVQNALDKLCTTLPIGSILVDGVQPASLWTEAKKLAEGVHVTWREEDRSESNPAWVVVMGGVPYKLPEAVVNSLDHRYRTIVRNVQSTWAKVVLSVGIGQVDITPSREDLRVTDKTTATLTEMVERFNLSLPAWIAETIDEAPSIVSAMILRRKLQSRIGSFSREHLDAATWKGRRMGVAKIEMISAEEITIHTKRGDWSGRKFIARRFKGVELVPNSQVERMLFVLNTPAHRVRSVQHAANPYLVEQKSTHEKGEGIDRVITLLGSQFKEEWFDTNDPAVLTVEYDEFVTQWKPMRAPTAPHAAGGVQYRVGSADKYADTLSVAELQELVDDGGSVLYLTTEDQGRVAYNNPFLMKAVSEHTVLFLKTTQKFEVLQKRIPSAKDAWAVIRKDAEKTVKSLSQKDLDTVGAIEFMSAVDSATMDFLKGLRNEITNPVVVDVLDTYRQAVGLRDNHSNRVKLLREAAAFLGTSLDLSNKTTFSTANYHKIMSGLPLLTLYIEYTWKQSPLGNKHCVGYINSTVL